MLQYIGECRHKRPDGWLVCVLCKLGERRCRLCLQKRELQLWAGNSSRDAEYMKEDETGWVD